MWPRLRRPGSMRAWRRIPAPGRGSGHRVGAGARRSPGWNGRPRRWRLAPRDAPLPLTEEGAGLRPPRPDAAPHPGEPGPKTPPSPATLADLAIDDPSFLQATRPIRHRQLTARRRGSIGVQVASMGFKSASQADFVSHRGRDRELRPTQVHISAGQPSEEGQKESQAHYRSISAL
jgi:hypothetical protein